MRTPTLPEWYLKSAVGTTDPRSPERRRRVGMPARRALASLAQALARDLSSLEQESWLSRIDPRAKILGILALVFGTTLLHSLWPLAAIFALIVILIFFSRVRPGRLIRAWVGVPLFSLIIILPATLNLVTPGSPVVTLWHIGAGVKLGPWILPEAVTVTMSGLVVAGRFLLRSVDCITLSFLLIATTEPAALVNGLRRLGMPRAFGMVLITTQRYLALSLRAAEEIHLTKLSRTITTSPTRAEGRWVAAGIGMLFRWTHRLAQEVQDAMISRGYTGDLRVKAAPGLHLSDYLWLGGAMTLTVTLVMFDRLL